MKKFILSGDNVLIKVALTKKSIILPSATMDLGTGKGYPEVVEMSDRAKETFPQMSVGSRVVMAEINFAKLSIMNLELGLTDPNIDKDCPHVYFVVKSFDITAVVVD